MSLSDVPLVGENDLRKLCPHPARLTDSARTQLRLTRGSPGGTGLTETLMLLELCEFCCAGAAYLSGAGLQHRRHGRPCFGTEGLEKPKALHIENTSARGWRQPRRDVPKGTTRPGRDLWLFRRRRCGALRHVATANVQRRRVQGRDKGRRV
jgi:hypothetical protein